MNIVKISKTLKPPLTFEEQLNRLIDENRLIIDDKEKALEFLCNNNYYTVSGYLKLFKEAITFTKLKEIILFDNKLRQLLYFIISKIELTLKTNIAYYFAHNYKYGNISYLSRKTFLENNMTNKTISLIITKHDNFIEQFKINKNRNMNMKCLKHHLIKYNGHIPIWAAVEIFTLGNLGIFYSILNKETKNDIAKEYKIPFFILEEWFKNLIILRNSVAHNNRIYGVSYTKPKNIINDICESNKIYCLIHMCKYLFKDKDLWNNYIIEQLETLLDNEYIEMEKIGFSKNWKEQLIKL